MVKRWKRLRVLVVMEGQWAHLPFRLMDRCWVLVMWVVLSSSLRCWIKIMADWALSHRTRSQVERSSYLTLILRRYSFPSIHAFLTYAVYHKPLVPSYLPNQLPLLDLWQPALCFRLTRYIWSVKDVGRNIIIKNAGMGGIDTVLWLEDGSGEKTGWLGSAGADVCVWVWEITSHT